MRRPPRFLSLAAPGWRLAIALGLPLAAVAQDLPRLSSGNEQLQWVDRRYPETDDAAARRWALERSTQLFADDPVTVFRAGVRLALLDWRTGHPDDARRRLGELLRHRSGRIDRDLAAWAETIDGRILADEGHGTEAAELLDRISGDGRLSGPRRALAAAALGDVLLPNAPGYALQVLQQMAGITGGNTPEVEAGLVHAQLVLRRDDEAARTLAAVGEHGPDDQELIATLQLAQAWSLPGDEERIERMAELASAVRPYAGTALKEAVGAARSQAAARRIQARLLGTVSAAPLAGWYHPASTDRYIPLSGFDRALAGAEQKGQPAQCLDLELRALAAHKPGNDFPLRLWQAAGFADWVARAGRAPEPSSPETALLDLCDLLPAGSTYFVEGKFLRARWRARTGDRAGEESALRDVLAFADLPARYLEPACRELGAALEARGEYSEAVQVYRRAEDQSEEFGSGVDCLQHAVFDNLQLGQNAEAVRLVHRIEQAPPAALAAATAPEEARELIAVTKSGQAADCWAATQGWWPDCARLAQDLGVPVETVLIPEIPSVDALHRAAGEERRKGRRSEFLGHYFLVVSAARWLPSYGVEAAALESAAADFAPDMRNEIRRLTIEILSSPHPTGIPGARERQLYLATDQYSAQDAAAALATASAFCASPQPSDGLTRAMHRIRALAALKAEKDYAASAAGLEADLASGAADAQRAMSVDLLADLNRRMERQDDARTSSAPDPIGGWIKAAGLSWYDYAEPRSLADSRLQNLEGVLQRPDKLFSPVETIKLRLLAAQDLRRTEDKRRRSFREAVRDLIQLAPDYASMDAVAKSVVNDARFDTETRVEVLWTILARLAEEGRVQDYASWRKLPLCGLLAPEFQHKIAVLDIEAAVDRQSSASILDAVDRLTGKELDSYGALAVEDFAGFLLRLGARDDAEALARKASSWRFAPGASPDLNLLQLDLGREIRLAGTLDPVHRALAQTLAARFGPGADTLPAAYAGLRMTVGLPVRSPSDTLAAALSLVRRSQFNRSDFSFWGTVLGALPRDSDTPATIGDLLRAALRAADGDEMRSELIVLFFSSTDTDDPAVRRALEREFAPYRDSARFPLCYLVSRLYEIHRDLRLGQPVPLETAFADLSDPRVDLVRERDCLRSYTVWGDRTRLRLAIDRIDSGRLLSSGFLPWSLEAFRFLGMSDALANARAVARRDLRQAILESWATRSEDVGAAALDLAEALGDADALPRDWVRDLGSGPGDPFFQERVRLMGCCLGADWRGAEAAAAELNRDYPNRYTYYWYRGWALHRLGRDVDAGEALRRFTQYAKDDLRYPEALRLLAALSRPEVAN